MRIKQLAQASGTTEQTIRYYESIGVLPPPRRLPNGYRDYDQTDIERLAFVAGLRRLDFSLDDIREILAMRELGEAPCSVVLKLLQEKRQEIAQRISELQHLDHVLSELYALGSTFPLDDVSGKNCVCHLIKEEQ